MNKKILFFVFLFLVTLSALIEVVHAENSFNDTIEKIDKFKTNQNKVSLTF